MRQHRLPVARPVGCPHTTTAGRGRKTGTRGRKRLCRRASARNGSASNKTVPAHANRAEAAGLLRRLRNPENGARSTRPGAVSARHWVPPALHRFRAVVRTLRLDESGTPSSAQRPLPRRRTWPTHAAASPLRIANPPASASWSRTTRRPRAFPAPRFRTIRSWPGRPPGPAPRRPARPRAPPKPRPDHNTAWVFTTTRPAPRVTPGRLGSVVDKPAWVGYPNRHTQSCGAAPAGRPAPGRRPDPFQPFRPPRASRFTSRPARPPPRGRPGP